MCFLLRFFLLGGGDLEDDWSESLKKSFTDLVNYDRGDLKSLGAKKNISFCGRSSKILKVFVADVFLNLSKGGMRPGF